MELSEKSEKWEKYLDLAREQEKKVWNIKVTVILILIGALSTDTKGLVKELEDLDIGGQMEIIKTKALFRSVRLLTRIKDIERDFLWIRLLWKTII